MLKWSDRLESPSPLPGIANMKKFCLALGLVVFAVCATPGAAEKIPYAKSEIVPPTPEWTAAVEQHAPAKPTEPTEPRKLLVFSLFTGFDHLVIPHVDRVFQIIGKKSGAFTADITTDIERLSPGSLADYDVLVLNNNCSVGPRRNLFLDELERNPKYAGMTAQQRQAKSDALEQSMLDFVAEGKGLVVIHGAPTLLNNSPKFTGMVGGAFDYHPPNQEVTVRPVDENHPLVAAFRGKGPFVHRDEPYCFNGAYDKLDFRPLLAMDVDGLKDPGGRVGTITRYVAWIKPSWQRSRVLLFAEPFPRKLRKPHLAAVYSRRHPVCRRRFDM